jgi:hypothetical protein
LTPPHHRARKRLNYSDGEERAEKEEKEEKMVEEKEKEKRGGGGMEVVDAIEALDAVEEEEGGKEGGEEEGEDLEEGTRNLLELKSPAKRRREAMMDYESDLHAPKHPKLGNHGSPNSKRARGNGDSKKTGSPHNADVTKNSPTRTGSEKFSGRARGKRSPARALLPPSPPTTPNADPLSPLETPSMWPEPSTPGEVPETPIPRPTNPSTERKRKRASNSSKGAGKRARPEEESHI